MKNAKSKGQTPLEAQPCLEGIEITRTPHHFVKDVACPYCKQKTIGIYEINPGTRYAFGMFCANVKCVTNFKSPQPSEVESAVQDNKELLRILEPQQIKCIQLFTFSKRRHLIEGIACPYCKKKAIGILSTPTNEKQTQFRMRCVNDECVTNFQSPVSRELDLILRQTLGIEQGVVRKGDL